MFLLLCTCWLLCVLGIDQLVYINAILLTKPLLGHIPEYHQTPQDLLRLAGIDLFGVIAALSKAALSLLIARHIARLASDRSGMLILPLLTISPLLVIIGGIDPLELWNLLPIAILLVAVLYDRNSIYQTASAFPVVLLLGFSEAAFLCGHLTPPGPRAYELCIMSGAILLLCSFLLAIARAILRLSWVILPKTVSFTNYIARDLLGPPIEARTWRLGVGTARRAAFFLALICASAGAALCLSELTTDFKTVFIDSSESWPNGIAAASWDTLNHIGIDSKPHPQLLIETWLLWIPLFLISASCLIPCIMLRGDASTSGLHVRSRRGIGPESSQTRNNTTVYYRSIPDVLALGCFSFFSSIKRKPIATAAGLTANLLALSMVAHLQQSSLAKGQELTVINLFLVATLAWVSPLLTCLTEISETLYFGARSTCLGALRKAHGHHVYVGYGDLARRLLDICSHHPPINALKLQEAKDVFLPNGTFIKVAPGIVIIEKDARDFIFLSEHSSEEIGFVAVREGQVPSIATSPITAVVGIRGDYNKSTVGMLASLQAASALIVVARDNHVPLLIADSYSRHNAQQLPTTVMAVGSSSNTTYASHLSGGNPFAQIHAENLRALALARHAYIAESLLQDDDQTALLVIGEGAEIGYLIDAYLRRHQVDAPSLKGRIPPPRIAVLSLDPRYSDNRFAYHRHPPHNSSADLHSDKGSIKQIRFDRRFQVPTEGASTRTYSFTSYSGDPQIHSVALACIEDFHPTTIVVTDPLSDRQILTMKSTVAALRTRSKTPFPYLIVGTETGSSGRATNMGNALIWLQSSSSKMDSRFNSAVLNQGETMIGPALVDVLRDPAHKLAAALAAHLESHRDTTNTSISTKIGACLANEVGSLARLIAALVGRTISWNPIESSPTRAALSGTRVYLGQGSGVFGSAILTLEKPLTAPKNVAINILRAMCLPGRALSLHPKSVLDKFWHNFLHTTKLEQFSINCDQCPEMTTCAVAIYQSHVRGMSSLDRPLEAYYAARKNLAGTLSSDVSSTKSLSSNLTIFGIHHNAVGRFAHILAALSFGRVLRTEKNPLNIPEEVFDVQYFADEVCEDWRASVTTLYGLVRKVRVIDAEEAAFELVLRTYSEPDSWRDYCLALVNFLNSANLGSREEPDAEWNCWELAINSLLADEIRRGSQIGSARVFYLARSKTEHSRPRTFLSMIENFDAGVPPRSRHVRCDENRADSLLSRGCSFCAEAMWLYLAVARDLSDSKKMRAKSVPLLTTHTLIRINS